MADDRDETPDDGSVDADDGSDDAARTAEGARPPAVDAPARPGWARRHRMLASAIAVVLFGGLLVGGANAWVRIDVAGHTFGTVDAPSAPVALVLGAGLRSDGTPSPYLAQRLDDAITLYRAGKVPSILVSGDNGTREHDEPTAMLEYLVAAGVPARAVTRDYAGFDTYDSCARAKRVFGVTRALVVTQQFHLPRAVFLCRQVGIDAVGVADAHEAVRPAFLLREIPAGVKAAWDALWQPDPHILGPHERVSSAGPVG